MSEYNELFEWVKEKEVVSKLASDTAKKKEISSIIKDFLRSGPQFKNGKELDKLVGYRLKAQFPDSGWEENGPQQPFDHYCVKDLVTVEVKTMIVERIVGEDGIVTFGKKNRIKANATLYPGQVKAKDVLTQKAVDRLKLSKVDTEQFMDVLLVTIEIFKEDDEMRIRRFEITNGFAEYGVRYEDYLGSKALFNDFNTLRDDIFKMIHQKKKNAFAESMLTGRFGDLITIDIRKLIYAANPIYRLDDEAT